MESLFQAIERFFIVCSELRGKHRPEPLPLPKNGIIGHVASGFDQGEPVCITPRLLEKHCYLLGATGAGKTNLILRLLEEDIRRNQSVVIVDLRGDLVERALGVCANLNVDPKDVRILDLREKEWVLGFNPLAGSGEPFIRALHLLDVIRGESASWGVQLEETLRNALLFLAANGKSLLDLERLLLDGDFATSLLPACDDPSVHGFFTRYSGFSPDKQLTWALPIFNKVTPLLSTPNLRAVLGTTNSLDLDSFLSQKGSILFVSLAVDELSRSARMMGSLIISAIARSMFSRVNTPEPKRNPVRLYVDEFEAMASEAFEGLIAEGRRFRLSLVLSHQNLAQLPTKLRSVIRNNVGLQGLFACGFQDATELMRELPDDIEIQDLLELPPGELFLMPRGKYPLHMKTLLAENTLRPQDIAEYRQTIIERHGVPMASIRLQMPQNPTQAVDPTTYTPWTLGGLS